MGGLVGWAVGFLGRWREGVKTVTIGEWNFNDISLIEQQ